MVQTTEEKKSVQTFPDAKKTGGQGGASPIETMLLSFYSRFNQAPVYWSYARDAWLREFVTDPGNDLLAGTVATVAAKVATTGFVLEGPERTANKYRKILVQLSDFGAGWSNYTQRWVWDYLGQDAGGWSERIRIGKRGAGAAIGFANLDNARIRITGDPIWPIRFTPVSFDGKSADEVLMHYNQVMHLVDSPTPNALRRGVGFCAVSRALMTAQILLDITTYERERLSDLPPAGLLMLNNMTSKQWEDVEKRYEMRQEQQGNRIWRDILTVFGMDPSLPMQAELLSFSQLPDNFDKKTATEIAIYSFALAFRIDPREIWPVSAGPMGTATEANIQHIKAKAKGAGLIMTDIERLLNQELSLPPTLMFRFDFQDAEEDLQSAEIADVKAQFLRRLTEPIGQDKEGIISREEGRQWLVKEGLFDEEDLLSFGPDESATDVAEAKSAWAIDMGPRARVYSDGRVVRLEKRPQVWKGHRPKGGAGSGHFGHAGRPGEVGGSLPEGESTAGRVMYEPTKNQERKWDKLEFAEMPTDEEFKERWKRSHHGKLAGWGMGKRNWIVSNLKKSREYQTGIWQGRVDRARDLEYSEERSDKTYNLGYYRGYTNYKSDRRGWDQATRERFDKKYGLPATKGGPGSGHFGHAGRPGEVGGSLPEGISGATRQWKPGTAVTTPDPESARKANELLIAGLETYKGTSLEDWRKAGMAARSEAKAELVAALVEKTGLDYDTVNTLIEEWTNSSADFHLPALGLQATAADIFGVQIRPSLLERIETIKSERGLGTGKFDPEMSWPEFGTWEERGISIEQQAAFYNGMYDLTQERLAASGFEPGDTIQLYRGVSFESGNVPDWTAGESIAIGGNPLQSWSLGRVTAMQFASGGEGGAILFMEVPIESIVSTARTGIGSLKEGEFVIMGGDIGHQAVVDWMR